MMRYLNPLLWYQLYDPNFNYNTEEHTVDYDNRVHQSRLKKKQYEEFKEPLSDGLLVSRTLLESRGKVQKVDGKYRIITTYNKEGFKSIRSFTKYWEPKIIFADPGTWSYVHKMKLPDYLYNTNDLIDYYNDFRFDLAGSVDWPIIDKIKVRENGKYTLVELDKKTKEMRRKLTLDLDKDFIQKCNKREDINFMPFGTIQGYDFKSYKDSIRQILKMGYRYIAVGGLPSSSEQYVVELMYSLQSEFKKYGKGIGIHLYGRFPSPKITKIFLKLGVTSFDNNTSFICSSGKSSVCYFFDPLFKTEGASVMSSGYLGVKLPSEKSPHDKTFQRLKKILPEQELQHHRKSVAKAFYLFCRYSENPNEKILRAFLKEYYKVLQILNISKSTPYSEAKMKKFVDSGRTVLTGKGWLRCGCTSCKLLKAHCTLNRGGNRIVHTFAHNTHIQYSRFLRELEVAKEKYSNSYDWTELEKIVKNNIKKSL